MCLLGRGPQGCILSSSDWKVVPICLRYQCIKSREQGWSLHLTPPPPAHLQPHPRWQGNRAPDLVDCVLFPSSLHGALWSWVSNPLSMSGIILCYAHYFPVRRGSCHCLCRKTRLGLWPSLASGVDKDKGVRPYSVDPASFSAFHGAGWVLTHWLAFALLTPLPLS